MIRLYTCVWTMTKTLLGIIALSFLLAIGLSSVGRAEMSWKQYRTQFEGYEIRYELPSDTVVVPPLPVTGEIGDEKKKKRLLVGEYEPGWYSGSEAGITLYFHGYIILEDEYAEFTHERFIGAVLRKFKLTPPTPRYLGSSPPKGPSGEGWVTFDCFVKEMEIGGRHWFNATAFREGDPKDIFEDYYILRLDDRHFLDFGASYNRSSWWQSRKLNERRKLLDEIIKRIEIHREGDAKE